MTGLHVLIVPSWWPSPEQPGAGIFCTDYASAFAAAGAKVGVIVPDLVSLRRVRWRSPPSILPHVSEESFDAIPVVRVRALHTSLGRPGLHMRRFLAWLVRGYARYVTRCGTPDVIHAHCAIPAGWAALRLAQRLAAPVVITEHTGPFTLALTPPAAGAMTRESLSQAAAVVAVSAALAGQMRAAGIARPIEIIPNPVDSAFSYAPPPARPNAPRFAFVGRLVREKGIAELAEAMLQLADDPHLAWHLHIVGDGPERTMLRRRLAPLIDRGRVLFHGHCARPQVLEVLRSCHALVLPSYGETGALAAAEALSVGRPVVATSGTGCEAVVGDGDGLLYAPRSATALAEAMRRLIREYDRWDASDIARRAAARFGAAAVATRYAALFDRECRAAQTNASGNTAD